MKKLHSNFPNEHFEYMEHGEEYDNADSLAPINDIGVFGIKVGTVRAVGGALGNMFGGKKEDTSTIGFDKFKAAGAGALPFYPTKEEMIQAAQNGFPDKAEPAAIQASYDPNTGVWQRGDWHFGVISTSPITAKAFKGATEGGTLKSTINAKIPVNVLPSQAQASMNIPTAGQFQGQTLPGGQSILGLDGKPIGQTQSAGQSSTSMPTAQTPGGQPLQSGQQSQSQNSPEGSPAGAASIYDQVKNLLPTGQSATGGQTTIYILVGVVVIGLILFLALKK